MSTYQQELLAWLQRYKHYPRRLRRRSVEGEVLVSFTLDVQGHLLEHEIVRGSGESALDEAAIDMLRAADPMPPMSEAVSSGRRSFTIPIRYALD